MYFHCHLPFLLCSVLLLKMIWTLQYTSFSCSVSSVIFKPFKSKKTILHFLKVFFSSTLYSFIWIWISIWHHFLSVWRTSFNISCSAAQLATVPSEFFCLSEHIFISPLFLKGIFVSYVIQGFFCFQHYKEVLGFFFFLIYVSTTPTSLLRA